MTLYKLTDQKHQTHGKTQWGEGVTHTTNGEGDLCGPGWLHAYPDPHLALLLDPIHGRYGDDSVLWLAEGTGGVQYHGGSRCLVTSLTSVKILDKSVISLAQRVEFAIRCAKAVCIDPTWNAWADAWLDGSDRSKRKAVMAGQAARAAAEQVGRAGQETWVVWEAARSAAAATVAATAEQVAWTAEWATGLEPVDFAPIIKQVFGT